jgi:hypothetical protein
LQAHTPDAHVPEPHAMPQPPQFAASVAGFAQIPCAAQATVSVGQAPHTPALHV